MNDALYIAATGMQAQQRSIDTLANNLANVSTPGFKKARVSFLEMMHAPQETAAQVPQSPTGMGISVDRVTKDFSQGALTPTGVALDLAIDGAGFIEVGLPDGSRAYTRGGSLKVTEDGYLATRSGLVLKPAIHIPADVGSVSIARDGTVQFQNTQTRQRINAGQLELVHFANPGALTATSQGVYLPNAESGDARFGKAGEEGLGSFAQATLESSNVSLVDEMVTLMVAQRAYELSSKVIQASDELMSLTNNLRR